jgi:hypothetical protein
LWKPNAHLCVCSCLLLETILRLINLPIYTLFLYDPHWYYPIICTWTDICHFPSMSSEWHFLYTFHTSYHAACTAPLILFELIILVLLGGEYKLRISLLCNFISSCSLYVPIYSSTCQSALFASVRSCSAHL